MSPDARGPRVGSKRPWTRNENIEAKKRQKSNYAQVPLSTILLATHGDKDGKAPELVFGGFYECTREAKFGKDIHFLRINVTKRKDNTSDTVSIPVPLESIGAVSVLSGMNKFEELLRAHTDRIALLASIERFGKVIEKREGVYAAKMEELALMPVIEDEPEEEVEVEPEDDAAKAEQEEVEVVEVDPVAEIDLTVDEATEEDAQEALMKKEQQEEEKRLAEEKKKLDDEKKAAAKMRLDAERKERELKREERRFVEVAVEKLAASVEKARKSLEDTQEKLEKIEEEYGEQLALFRNETDSAEAQQVFLESLQQEEAEVVQEVASEQAQEDASVAEEATEKAETTGEAEIAADTPEGDEEKAAEKEADAEVVEEIEKEQEDIEMAEKPATGICTSCGAPGAESRKFCGECGAKQGEIVVQKEEKFESITESPVWLVLALKKPLEKFYATDVDTTICNKDLLEKSSMIVLGYNQEKPSLEHLKSLNEVLEGPWKEIRKKAETPMSDSPYSLKKTLQYLVKMHVRQDVSDNTMEICELCGGSIKRMDLERHMTQICMMRKEECPYCGKVFVMKMMDEHHQTDCEAFPIPCPQKCGIAKFPRSDVEEHFKVCKNTIVSCTFDTLGCEIQVKRREVARHMRDSAVDHVELLKTRLKLVTDYLQSNDQDLVQVFNPPPPPPAEEADAEEGGDEATAEAMETEQEQ